MVDTVAKCPHWAVAFGGSLVVNYLPLHAILLAGDLKNGHCGSQEAWQWGCIWNDGVMVPEGDIFDPKLLSAALCGQIALGVFPYVAKVEECNRDEVACCFGLGVGCGTAIV